jgi:hypothetical protein
LRRREVCFRNFPLLTIFFLNLSMLPQLFQVIQDSLASPPGSSSNNSGKFPGLVPLLFQAGLVVRISLRDTNSLVNLE